MNNERTTGFLGSLAESTRAEEKRHRGTEGTEAEVAHLSVPSVPLWFKRLDKNVVLLGALSFNRGLKHGLVAGDGGRSAS